jgi:hypothetical protein
VLVHRVVPAAASAGKAVATKAITTVLNPNRANSFRMLPSPGHRFCFVQRKPSGR